MNMQIGIYRLEFDVTLTEIIYWTSNDIQSRLCEDISQVRL